MKWFCDGCHRKRLEGVKKCFFCDRNHKNRFNLYGKRDNMPELMHDGVCIRRDGKTQDYEPVIAPDITLEGYFIRMYTRQSL
jgi:hypothetical protein